MTSINVSLPPLQSAAHSTSRPKTQSVHALRAEMEHSPEVVNVFALLRELTALLKQLYETGMHHKSLQSLHQFHLHLKSAEMIRDTGDQRFWLGCTKFIGMGIVLIPQLARQSVLDLISTYVSAQLSAIIGTAATRIPTQLSNVVIAARDHLTPHSFSIASQGVEGLLSLRPQSKIASNDAFNKEVDAYVQSTNSVLDSISKQLDQLSQMIREIITQSIKDVQAAHYQALGSMLR